LGPPESRPSAEPPCGLYDTTPNTSNALERTDSYNRSHLHDPDDRSPEILKLHKLHAEMGRAVLDAYGWTSLKPTREFPLDYEYGSIPDIHFPGRTNRNPARDFDLDHVI
jgi:hypothetical protein